MKKGGIFVISTRSCTTEAYKLKFDKVVENLEKDNKIEILDQNEFAYYENVKDSDVKSVVYAFKKK